MKQALLGKRFQDKFSLNIFYIAQNGKKLEEFYEFVKVEGYIPAVAIGSFTHEVPSIILKLESKVDLIVEGAINSSDYNHMDFCSKVTTLYKQNGCKIQFVEMISRSTTEKMDEFPLSGKSPILMVSIYIMITGVYLFKVN